MDTVTWTRKCVGCAAAAMVGDAMGAAFEGQSCKDVNSAHPNGIRTLEPAAHMGVYQLGERLGCYTDDTNSAFALLRSLVERGCMDGHHAAYVHAQHWHDGFARPPLRGYPNSAQAMMLATLGGEKSAHECATRAFADGSFANGAAMKVWPVGLAFHAVPIATFRAAVAASCMYSHVHPLGVDAGVVQAYAVRLAAHTPSDAPVIPAAFLDELRGVAATGRMTAVLEGLASAFEGQSAAGACPPPTAPFPDRAAWLYAIGAMVAGRDHIRFQIEGPGAVGCALAAFLMGQADVNETIASAIAIGGDTDTIASMAAACSGAHCGGIEWCHDDIWGAIEDDVRGKTWVVELATQFAAMTIGGDAATLEVVTDVPYVATPADRVADTVSAYFRTMQTRYGVPLKRAQDVASRSPHLPAFSEMLSDVYDAAISDGASSMSPDLAEAAVAVIGRKVNAPAGPLDRSAWVSYAASTFAEGKDRRAPIEECPAENPPKKEDIRSRMS